LIWAISVFLWTGDLQSAEEFVGLVISRATSHSLAPYLAVGRGFQGELSARRGDVKRGVETLQSSLQVLHGAPYELLSTPLDVSLAQGLAALDRLEESIALIEETIRRVEAGGDNVYMPELLRVKGSMLLSSSQQNSDDAEGYFVQSLELSRAHGSRAWQLRTATDLAGLWSSQGRSDDARELLQPVFAQFNEGLDTADLKAAERLLATLS
jgi:predicted ATPase